MELNEILQVALRGGASDIHLKAGLPPMFRVDGSLVPLKDARRLPPEEISRMAFGIMNDYQKEKFKTQNELDLAYGVPGLGRVRVNVFQQGATTLSFARALKPARPQPPAVPRGGKRRARAPTEAPPPAADPEHLVPPPLHPRAARDPTPPTPPASPPHQQKQVRLQLGSVLK